MKILTGTEETEQTARFTLEQSGGDVDIHCNGRLIAFFTVGGNNKVNLRLVDGADASIFDVYEDHVKIG